MMQRIQSLYLFLVFVFTVLFGLLPMAHFPTRAPGMPLRLFEQRIFFDAFEQLSRGWLGIALLVLFMAILVLTFYTTFQFRRRLFQIKLGKLNILLHVALILVTFFFIDNVRSQLGYPEFSYGSGVVFPLISLLLILMANRAIRRDENLVRSADRIR